MRTAAVITLFLLTFKLFSSFAQDKPEPIKTWFEEIKSATEKNTLLWNKNIYGEILLVDPENRNIYSNSNDSLNTLKEVDRVFTGTLPKNINIANTSVKWNGKEWAMIMLPLPDNKEDRINLLAHELFHRIQPSLGFKLFNADNQHLDKKNGRIYLRLELEALVNAISSSDIVNKKHHLTNAIIFRKYRNMLFPGTDSTENLLELNEGLAEYTGMIISGRNNIESVSHFEKSVKEFQDNPTFVRSFAYQTIPMYGYLLREINSEWNKSVTVATNLVSLFIGEHKIELPDDLKVAVERIKNLYDGKKITAEENVREEKAKIKISELKKKFTESSHLIINFEQMNVSFDPRNIIPLDENGTYYPNIRITDKWGILTVTNGALMSPNWDKVTLTPPLKEEGKKIIGDGWLLEVENGYEVKETDKNYFLMRK